MTRALAAIGFVAATVLVSAPTAWSSPCVDYDGGPDFPNIHLCVGPS